MRYDTDIRLGPNPGHFHPLALPFVEVGPGKLGHCSCRSLSCDRSLESRSNYRPDARRGSSGSLPGPGHGLPGRMPLSHAGCRRPARVCRVQCWHCRAHWSHRRIPCCHAIRRERCLCSEPSAAGIIRPSRGGCVAEFSHCPSFRNALALAIRPWRSSGALGRPVSVCSGGSDQRRRCRGSRSGIAWPSPKLRRPRIRCYHRDNGCRGALEVVH